MSIQKNKFTKKHRVYGSTAYYTKFRKASIDKARYNLKLYLKKLGIDYLGTGNLKKIFDHCGVSYFNWWACFSGRKAVDHALLQALESKLPGFKASEWYIAFGIFPVEWELFCLYRPMRAWYYIRQILRHELQKNPTTQNAIKDFDSFADITGETKLQDIPSMFRDDISEQEFKRLLDEDQEIGRSVGDAIS